MSNGLLSIIGHHWQDERLIYGNSSDTRKTRIYVAEFSPTMDAHHLKRIIGFRKDRLP
jgi:hypothetical protein